MLQKNIQDTLGQPGGNLGTARQYLAGCGTQTAALAFGGYTTGMLNQLQKNMMVLLGPGGNLNTARFTCRCWYTNSRISFWWL
jgi:hypothetical protein